VANVVKQIRLTDMFVMFSQVPVKKTGLGPTQVT
jgi:hypothetical protein